MLDAVLAFGCVIVVLEFILLRFRNPFWRHLELSERSVMLVFALSAVGIILAVSLLVVLPPDYLWIPILVLILNSLVRFVLLPPRKSKQSGSG